LTICIARILAANPYSADVEGLISYYNILKTPMRSQLSPETIKDSLYVKLNIAIVINFDPLSSVLCWLSEKDRHGKVQQLAKTPKWYQSVFEGASTKDKLILHTCM
jgi:hypothetical protein